MTDIAALYAGGVALRTVRLLKLAVFLQRLLVLWSKFNIRVMHSSTFCTSPSRCEATGLDRVLQMLLLMNRK